MKPKFVKTSTYKHEERNIKQEPEEKGKGGTVNERKTFVCPCSTTNFPNRLEGGDQNTRDSSSSVFFSKVPQHLRNLSPFPEVGGERKKGVNIMSSSDETNRTFISTSVVCRVEGSEGGGQEKSVRKVVVELPSQALPGDEGADHNPGHQGHPRQQPLLETLLRPPALCRCVLPKDFGKSFLGDMKKK